MQGMVQEEEEQQTMPLLSSSSSSSSSPLHRSSMSNSRLLRNWMMRLTLGSILVGSVFRFWNSQTFHDNYHNHHHGQKATHNHNHDDKDKTNKMMTQDGGGGGMNMDDDMGGMDHMDDDMMGGNDFCKGMSMIMSMSGFQRSLFTTKGKKADCMTYFVPAWKLDNAGKFQGAMVYSFLLAILTEGMTMIMAWTRSSVVLKRYHNIRKILLTCLYPCQHVLGYLIMFVTMMYSYELIASVLLGVMVGRAMFGPPTFGNSNNGRIIMPPQRRRQQQQQQQQQSQDHDMENNDSDPTLMVPLLVDNNNNNNITPNGGDDPLANITTTTAMATTTSNNVRRRR